MSVRADRQAGTIVIAMKKSEACVSSTKFPKNEAKDHIRIRRQQTLRHHEYSKNKAQRNDIKRAINGTTKRTVAVLAPMSEKAAITNEI